MEIKNARKTGIFGAQILRTLGFLQLSNSAYLTNMGGWDPKKEIIDFDGKPMPLMTPDSRNLSWHVGLGDASLRVCWGTFLEAMISQGLPH